jgi:hypothetical protein
MDPILKEALQAMTEIALQGGNLPEEGWTNKGGPNDARQRGCMYINCRDIARRFIQKHDPKGEVGMKFDDQGTPILL